MIGFSMVTNGLQSKRSVLQLFRTDEDTCIHINQSPQKSESATNPIKKIMKSCQSTEEYYIESLHNIKSI